MTEWFKARYGELFESVVDPMWSWVLGCPWIVRALLLLVVSLGIAAWFQPAAFVDAYEASRFRLQRVVAGEARLPLPAEVRERNRRTARRLAASVSNDLGDFDPLTPWSVSQAIVGLAKAGESIEDRDRLLDFVRSARRPACYCWTELAADPDDAVHVAISGWVLATHAALKEPLSAGDLSSLLALQNGQGWWPTFPNAIGRDGAFTYATAWMLLGLIELRETRLVPVEMDEPVNRAIRRATSWLMVTRTTEQGWKDYPYYRFGKVSPAITALVLHVLHRAGVQDLDELDRAWLASLPPPDAPAVLELDLRYVELRTQNGIRIDHLTQVPMAWLVIATADAYQNGTFEQRTEALKWLDALSAQPAVLTADATVNNWWRAELLYALSHLDQRVGAPR